MVQSIYIASTLLSLANGTVLLFLNPHRAINRVFFAASVWIALWFICILMAMRAGTEYTPETSEVLLFRLRLSSALSAFLGWYIWMLKFVLISDKPSVLNAVRRSWPLFFLGCLLAGIAFSEWFIPSHSTPANKIWGPAYYIYAAVMAAMGLAFLFDGIRLHKRLAGIQKVEMQFFVLNTTGACLLLVFSNTLSHFVKLDWLRHSGPIWFAALHGATVWAVCYHKVFDGKQILLSLCQRLVLLIVMGGGAVALATAIRRFAPGPLNMFLAGIAICALAIVCDRPMRKWLGLDSQYRLHAPRAQIIEWARNIPDETKLRHHFEEFLRNWCQTDRAILLSKEPGIHSGQGLSLPGDWSATEGAAKDGWLTPESLQRRRRGRGTQECADYLSKHSLGALLTVPKGSPTPSLVIALGQKHSLRPYTYPDIQLLLDLAELMDNILTHCRVAAHSTHIEKMEAAAMMSRGLAHDLNNLATPVSTFLLHMENRIAEGSAEAAVLADAKHSIKVMQDYIQESLFFARRLVPEFKPIISTDILSSALRLTQERAQWHGVNVTVHTDHQVTFRADRVLIQRLLQNLIFNGIDASKRNGTVEVSAVADKDHLRFTVTDHGVGIPVEIMDRIFEPYFTTKDTGDEVRGLGLGLAICRKIADLHRGRIEVSSILGQGATIAVVLPQSQAPGGIASPDPLVAEAAT